MSKTILLVEDDRIISLTQMKTIQSFDYKVVQAFSGEEALEIAIQYDNINLILMDIDLGRGMDGTKTAELILQHRNIPIVFLTSHSEKETVEKVRGITRYGYVLKNSGNFVLQSSIEMAFELFDAYNKTRESERKYRDLFEGSRDGVVIVDANGKFIGANQAYCKMLGYTLEELKMMKDFYQITPKKWHKWEQEEIWTHRLLQQGYTGVYEKEYIRKDGTILSIEMQAFTNIDVSGKLTYLWGITRDITQRKKSEKELEKLRESELNRSRQALKERNNMFETLLKTTLDGFAIVSTSGQILEVNEQFCKIYSYDKEKILKMSIFDFEHQETYEEAEQHMRKIMEKGSEIFESVHYSKDGIKIYIEISATYTLLKGGMFIVFIRDITDKKRMEQLELELIKEKEINDLRTRFISIASHEFKTPLTGIKVSAQLLEKNILKWNDDKKKMYLKKILISVDRMNELIEDVLTLGRYDIGNILIHYKLIDINQLCKDIIEEIQTDFEEQCKIQYTCFGNEYIVSQDPKIVHQIIENLLTNAIKYSKPGYPNIELILNILDSKIEFVIKDYGIGMPKKDQEFIFEPFIRGTNVNQITGSGLGLAIVKKLVDILGGIIYFESEENYGTTFFVNLPIQNV